MAEKRIRQLTINMGEGRNSFIHYVGQVRRLPIGEREITQISETSDVFVIYIANGAVAQEWISIPKEWKHIVEFYID